MKRFKILTLGAVVAATSLLLTPAPANAAASIGAGATCDPSGVHCVTVEAAGVGAGTTITGGQFVGLCKADTTGALVTTVTCSHAGRSSTTSLPGSSSVAAVTTSTGSLTGHTVCWTATGFFTEVTGGVIAVTDAGCAIVTL